MIRTILAHGDWGGLIFWLLLVLVAIVAVSAFVIAMSWWVMSRNGGSTDLFWGALLGVGAVHVMNLVFRHWSIHELYQSVLPSAALASALACLVNRSVRTARRRRDSVDR